MFLIKVIPIAKGVRNDELSYFSNEKIEIGSIAEIEIRSRKILSLVVSAQDVLENKSELKNLDYKLKKIKKVKGRSFLDENFLEAVYEISKYYISPIGSILNELIPKEILEDDELLVLKDVKTNKPDRSKYEILSLQTDKEERFALYKSYIREEFAKKNSVLFCLPNKEEVKKTFDKISKGIENYTYLLYDGQNKKEFKNIWKNILTNEHPIVLITTGYFLSIPRSDFGTYIVEEENSRGYISQRKPYFDIRKICEFIAKKNGKKLVFGDSLLRIETLYKTKNFEYSEFSPLKFRLTFSSTSDLIDARNPKETNKKEFEIFDEKFKNVLNNTSEENGNTFIFCLRKGLYPITVCSDCGETVLCNTCKSPVILYEKKNKDDNYFACNKCGERRSALELCKKCNSWKLTPLGIGIENVYKETKRLFPDKEIFILDKDNVKTENEAKKIVTKFYQKIGSILIGTEFAIKFLDNKINTSSVVSIDALFSIPDFKINEKIMQMLLKIQSLAEKRFVIQTRIPDNKIINYCLRGNLIDFYKSEIEDRKEMDYPPFSIFIKISLSGEKNTIKSKMEEVKNFLKPYELLIYEPFYKSKDNKPTINGLLKLKRINEENSDLYKKLKMLTPDFSIKIEPDTLL